MSPELFSATPRKPSLQRKSGVTYALSSLEVHGSIPPSPTESWQKDERSPATRSRSSV